MIGGKANFAEHLGELGGGWVAEFCVTSLGIGFMQCRNNEIHSVVKSRLCREPQGVEKLARLQATSMSDPVSANGLALFD